MLFKQIANKAIEMKNKEINEAVEKLKMAELKKQEWEQNSRKLEEDVPRLRQALEQSITRLNRMSSDSDFYVDRSEPTISQLCTLGLTGDHSIFKPQYQLFCILCTSHGSSQTFANCAGSMYPGHLYVLILFEVYWRYFFLLVFNKLYRFEE